MAATNMLKSAFLHRRLLHVDAGVFDLYHLFDSLSSSTGTSKRTRVVVEQIGSAEVKTKAWYFCYQGIAKEGKFPRGRDENGLL